MSVAITLELLGIPYGMAFDKHGTTMLSEPIREGDGKWGEETVFGSQIIEYLFQEYDTEKEFSYEKGSSKAAMVADRAKFVFESVDGNDMTITMLCKLEYYLHNSVGFHVVGNTVTLADIVWFPYIYLNCIPAIDSGMFPNVRQWYFQMAAISDLRKGVLGAGWDFESKEFRDLLARGLLYQGRL
ncbi:hypothetical protein BJX68DRAFT_271167 [Aspergillus pseudodeflectus]|uniref:Glutathione S-transferase n=1 Tax=Aspergillus pseudodeflectus TaxID=176178 RepID=A0ABR4JND3_9EURO